jgi:hypothetical protein
MTYLDDGCPDCGADQMAWCTCYCPVCGNDNHSWCCPDCGANHDYHCVCDTGPALDAGSAGTGLADAGSTDTGTGSERGWEP